MEPTTLSLRPERATHPRRALDGLGILEVLLSAAILAAVLVGLWQVLSPASASHERVTARTAMRGELERVLEDVTRLMRRCSDISPLPAKLDAPNSRVTFTTELKSGSGLAILSMEHDGTLSLDRSSDRGPQKRVIARRVTSLSLLGNLQTSPLVTVVLASRGEYQTPQGPTTRDVSIRATVAVRNRCGSGGIYVEDN